MKLLNTNVGAKPRPSSHPMPSSSNTQVWGANSCNHRFCVCKHPVAVNISPTRHTRPTNPSHSERQECSLNSHATIFSTKYSLNFTNKGQDPLIHCNLSNKEARRFTPKRQISHKRKEKPPLSLNSQATIFCTKAPCTRWISLTRPRTHWPLQFKQQEISLKPQATTFHPKHHRVAKFHQQGPGLLTQLHFGRLNNRSTPKNRTPLTQLQIEQQESSRKPQATTFHPKHHRLAKFHQKAQNLLTQLQFARLYDRSTAKHMTPLTDCNLSDKNVRKFPGIKFPTKRCKRNLLCPLPAKDSELLGAQNRPPLLLRLLHLGLSTSRRRSHGQSSSPPRTALHRYNTTLPSGDQGARRRPLIRKGADGTQRADTDGGLNSRGASCCCSCCSECVQCGGQHDCHSHHSFYSEVFSVFSPLSSASRPVPSLPASKFFTWNMDLHTLPSFFIRLSPSMHFLFTAHQSLVSG